MLVFSMIIGFIMIGSFSKTGSTFTYSDFIFSVIYYLCATFLVAFPLYIAFIHK